MVAGGKMGKMFVRYCLKGSIFKNASTTTTVFSVGSKKRKSNNEDKHNDGQEKNKILNIMLREKSVVKEYARRGYINVTCF